MKTIAPITAAVLACAGVLAAQSSWQVEGGRARARVVGEGALRMPVGGHEVALGARPKGSCRAHFPATGAGKPRSLELQVPAGAAVVLGVASAPPIARRPLTLDTTGALSAAAIAEPLSVHTASDAALEQRDYRLSATASREAGCEMFGLLGRYSERGGCYLLALDWSKGEVRLERWLGEDRLVLGRADAPPNRTEVTLSLQVNGLRVEGSVDDALLVRALDGAITAGKPGVAWSGVRPAVSRVWAQPAAAALASVAVVRSGRAATLYAAVPQPPSSVASLELMLDRPHGWIPRDSGGFELWLSQPWAAPVVAWGVGREDLGSPTLTEVDVDGRLQAVVSWPDLPALAKQVALARWHVVSPSGDSIVATTPAARVVF